MYSKVSDWALRGDRHSVLAACSGVKSPQRRAASPEGANDAFHDLSLDQALNKARDDGKVVMIDFSGDNCIWCRKLDQDTWTDSRVQDWLRDNTIAIKIDVGKHGDLKAKYKVKGIPAIVFLRPDGSEVGRIPGYLGPNEFLQVARDLIEGNKVSSNWIPTHDLRR